MNSSDNGILSAIRAMPLKDLTSNNENFFSMKRTLYTRSATTRPSNDVYLTKKYYGAVNHDASSRTRQMSASSVGSGLNYDQKPLSYTTVQTNNLVQGQALQRVRNSGYIIPRKVSQANVD